MDSPYDFPLPQGPVENPGNWHGDLMARSQDWIHRLSADSVAEIDTALSTVKAKGLRPEQVGKEDFPLPTLTPTIHGILEQLETGRGFVLLRGFPIGDYDDTDTEFIFSDLGRHLGTPVSQNADGDLLGHVRDLGLNVTHPKVRNYQTSAELRPHNDSCDVLGLMCAARAKSGGDSRLTSVVAVHNSMMREDPNLLRELYRPLAIDRRGEPGRPDEGDAPYYRLPVFSYFAGYLSARFTVRHYYDSATRYEGVAPLTATQQAALDLLEDTAARPETSFGFAFEPGDILLVNNYCVFHSRTAFEDYPEPERRRHMLRLWLSVPNSRPLPPWFEARFGSVAPGAVRGGIHPWLAGGAATGESTARPVTSESTA